MASVCLISCDNFDSIATINYSSQGCFAAGQSKLILYKSGNLIFAKLESDDKPTLRTELNSSQVDTFNLFIKQLKTLEEGGFCTTQSFYDVVLINETIRKTDGGCQWHGFSKLKACFFRDSLIPTKKNNNGR